MDVAIVESFRTSFGAFDKSLIVCMLGIFRFNNQFIDLHFFLMRKLVEKTYVKLGIIAAVAVSGNGRVNLKAFTRRSTPGLPDWLF